MAPDLTPPAGISPTAGPRRPPWPRQSSREREPQRYALADDRQPLLPLQVIEPAAQARARHRIGGRYGGSKLFDVAHRAELILKTLGFDLRPFPGCLPARCYH